MNSSNTPHLSYSDVQAQVVSSALAGRTRTQVDLSGPLDALMLPRVPWGHALAPMCHLAHLVTTLEVVHPVTLDLEEDAA
ncbi:MAG: hypothetical protein ACE366_11320 [Bradymonadia bacterium]